MTVVITEPLAALSGNIITQTNVSCNGSANGSAVVVATGGIAPYEYSFNGGAYVSSGNVNGLAAATYTMTIRDANLCTADVLVSISEPEVLSLSSTVENASCPETPDGKITLGITGGTGPYTVIWEDGVITPDRLNVTDGTYRIVVTDFNGCSAQGEVIVDVIGSGSCIAVQEIITPNNDGYNDTWKIKNIELFPNAEVFVYSRWGKLVFHTKNISANEWDGTFKGKTYANRFLPLCSSS